MRPGGNPNIKKYSFTPKGAQAKTEQLLIRVDAEVKEFLNKRFGENKSDFLREVINKAIAELKASETNLNEIGKH